MSLVFLTFPVVCYLSIALPIGQSFYPLPLSTSISIPFPLQNTRIKYSPNPLERRSPATVYTGNCLIFPDNRFPCIAENLEYRPYYLAYFTFRCIPHTSSRRYVFTASIPA